MSFLPDFILGIRTYSVPVTLLCTLCDHKGVRTVTTFYLGRKVLVGRCIGQAGGGTLYVVRPPRQWRPFSRENKVSPRHVVGVVSRLMPLHLFCQGSQSVRCKGVSLWRRPMKQVAGYLRITGSILPWKEMEE